MFILWSVTKRALVMISNSFGGCNLALALSTPGQVTRAGESVPAEALPGADHNDVSPRSFFLSDTTPRSSRPKRVFILTKDWKMSMSMLRKLVPHVSFDRLSYSKPPSSFCRNFRMLHLPYREDWS